MDCTAKAARGEVIEGGRGDEIDRYTYPVTSRRKIEIKTGKHEQGESSRGGGGARKGSISLRSLAQPCPPLLALPALIQLF